MFGVYLNHCDPCLLIFSVQHTSEVNFTSAGADEKWSVTSISYNTETNDAPCYSQFMYVNTSILDGVFYDVTNSARSGSDISHAQGLCMEHSM